MDTYKGLEHLRTLVIDAANDKDPEEDPEKGFEVSAGIKNVLSWCRFVLYLVFISIFTKTLYGGGGLSFYLFILSIYT